MQPSELATFRYHLKGLLGDYIDKTSFKGILAADDLLEIAAGVVYHVEEGKRLYPEVVVCGDIDVLMKQQAPNSQYLQMGVADSARLGVPKALKKLSPLTSRDWLILLEVRHGKCRFGIFNPSPSPLTLGVATMLQDGPAGPFIRVTSPCEDIVQIASPEAGTRLISFSHKEIGKGQLEPNAETLATCILSGCGGVKHVDSAKTYVKRVLESALQRCHGALICVVEDESQLPDVLASGIMITPPIDFMEMVSSFSKNDENNELKGRPFLFFDLVSGIISFDGVCVFSVTGKMLGYNFILNLDQAKSGSDSLGGSRKTAFKLLCTYVGKGLHCAYYQSQDGPSEIKIK
jgi:hypothetical protein